MFYFITVDIIPEEVPDDFIGFLLIFEMKKYYFKK